MLIEPTLSDMRLWFEKIVLWTEIATTLGKCWSEDQESFGGVQIQPQQLQRAYIEDDDDDNDDAKCEDVPQTSSQGEGRQDQMQSAPQTRRPSWFCPL